MNNWLIPILVGFIALAAYVERDRWMPQKVVYVQAPTPTPTPAPPPPAPIIRTPTRHLALPGTLYVVRYFSVRTPKGVVGFTPGQEIQEVRGPDDAGRLLVSDGSQQVEVKSVEVTNDLDIAALLNRQDQQSQLALQAALQADSEDDTKSRRKVDIDEAKRLAKMRTSSVVGESKALNEPS